MIFKLFGIVVTFIIGAILGLRISKDIDNSVLYTLFWILYVITYITFANIIAVGLFYNILRDKTGPPGQRGPQGEVGEIGSTGVCQNGCKELECKNDLKDFVVEVINDIAGNPVPPVKLTNLLLLNQIHNLCTSKQFSKVAEIKGAQPAISYIKDIFREWLKILYDAGGKEFFEEPGGEENYAWNNGKNPFKEIEKYDIYYWKMNKLFKPIGVDVCDDTSVNKKMPQKHPDKPLLYMIHSNIYDETAIGPNNVYKTFRARGVYNEKVQYNMYPVGDVAVSGGHEISGPKYIDGMGAPQNNRDGPKKPSVLIAGKVTTPERFEKSGDFWKMIPKDGYVCLGDVGDKSPNKYKYRCVPKECAERVSDTLYNGQYIYQGNGAIWGVPGSQRNGLGNSHGNKNYNLFRVTEGRDGHHRAFYKIKEGCLTSAKPTKIPIGEGDWISNRWFGFPERDPKYSIFNFLGIVPEGTITNKETGRHYHFVTSATEPNSFFIKHFSVGTKKYGNLEVIGLTNVGINYAVNRDKIEQLWYLDYTNPNNVYIRSIKTKKYLGLHYYHGKRDIRTDEKRKHLLKPLQYDKPNGNRTNWKIEKTTTGQRNVKQRVNGKLPNNNSN